jgi:hypothetical protein
MHCSASRPYICTYIRGTAIRNILIFGLATDAKTGFMGNWHLVFMPLLGMMKKVCSYGRIGIVPVVL